MIGALIVDVAADAARPRLEIVFSDAGLLWWSCRESNPLLYQA
jgi:hypothetical protein